MHRDNVRRALHRLAADYHCKRLGNLSHKWLERWLVTQKKAGMGARTRNTCRAAVTACPVKQNNPLTTAVNGLLRERETGIEPATTSLGRVLVLA